MRCGAGRGGEGRPAGLELRRRRSGRAGLSRRPTVMDTAAAAVGTTQLLGGRLRLGRQDRKGKHGNGKESENRKN